MLTANTSNGYSEKALVSQGGTVSERHLVRNEDAVEKVADVPSTADTERTVPVLAEELMVTKRKVDTGRVRVNTVTHEHDALVNETLSKEKVEVERIAVGKVIDAIPAVRNEGDVIVIPVVEEELLIERRLILKEEVRIRRVHETEGHQERVTLRRQEAVITHVPADTQSPNANSMFGDSQ